MPKLRNGMRGDSNPGSVDCEFGILPLSYHAPHVVYNYFLKINDRQLTTGLVVNCACLPYQ